MKKEILLLCSAMLMAFSAQSQCPGGDITIDTFDGSTCNLVFSNSDPLNTVKSVECNGMPALSGSADIWMQKLSGVAGGTSGSGGYYNVGIFDATAGAGGVYAISVTYDGNDSNTDPNSPTLTGPVLGNFTGKEIHLENNLDDMGAGSFLTFTVSVWDAAGNKSEATLTLNGPRAEVTEISNLGLLTGAANLADVRAIQLTITTNHNGMDLILDKLSAVCPTVLPVDLISFDGKNTNGITDLNWVTATEANADHFEVQSSDDALNFTAAGTVSAKGNSSTAVKYQFSANELLENVKYYRLRMVDVDGSEELSRIIAVEPWQNDFYQLIAYPTVFDSYVRISLKSKKDETATVLISDQSGGVRHEMTRELREGTNTFDINNLDHLAPGMYNVLIITEAGKQYRKIIKQ